MTKEENKAKLQRIRKSIVNLQPVNQGHAAVRDLEYATLLCLQQLDRVEALEKALQGMLDIVDSTYGVVGYSYHGEKISWKEINEVTVAQEALK